MARKPKSQCKLRRSRRRAARPTATRSSTRFMALLAEKPFEEIGFAEIARRAGVSLSELRAEVRLEARDPRRAYARTSTARCSTASTPTWPTSRRASGCSTC